jgi:dTDP-4-amino-4,6-dideoxygalactose transaminase
MTKIQVSKPYFPREDVEEIVANVRSIFDTGMLIQGKFVREFEQAFADYVGTRYARAVNSGTGALQAALNWFGVRDREVLVPVNTFLASANAVLFEGGKPVFVEMDPDTLCLDFEDLQRKTTEKTRGLILVHMAGLIPPDVERIRDFCRSRGLFVLEDASHAQGSSHAGRRAGAWGDAAAFSLLATKVITSGGEGGIVTTDDEGLAHRVESLRFHGEDHTRGVQDRIGYSWRMTEMQAIVGLTQVHRLDEIIAKRMDVGRRYDAAFSAMEHARPVRLAEGVHCAYYKYPLILRAPLDRETVKKRLEEEHGVRTGTSYWPPCHLQPAYRKAFGYKEGDFPVAEAVLDRTISLPMYCDLTDEEVERVITGVARVCA